MRGSAGGSVSALASGAVLWLCPGWVLAQDSAPSHCSWISEVTPAAEIRFRSSTGTGWFIGDLLYRGERILEIQEGLGQGYGTHWWSSREQDERPSEVVLFLGDRVARSLTEAQRSAAGSSQRVILVGLASRLWYAEDPRWRDQPALLRAAEGFWRVSAGCRRME